MTLKQLQGPVILHSRILLARYLIFLIIRKLVLATTKSSALVFYAICFLVLKPCSYWNSETSDAIVECGSTFFFDTIKSQCSSVLPQNVNIYGAIINVNFASSRKGTLVCTSSSSKVGLERFILQTQSKNTGFLLYFPELCYSCVFHKTSRSTTFFFNHHG